MMKRVILLILVFSFALLIGGCSAFEFILEGAYPNATGVGDGGDSGGSNTVKVYVSLSDYIINDSAYYNWNRPIVVELWKDNGYGGYDLYDGREFWAMSYIEMTFDWLPSARYQVVAYYDEIYNYQIDSGEIWNYAYDYNYMGDNYVDVAGDGNWYELSCYLN